MMMMMTLVMIITVIMMMVSLPLSLPACMCGVAYGSACTGTACGISLKPIIIGLVPWIFVLLLMTHRVDDRDGVG